MKYSYVLRDTLNGNKNVVFIWGVLLVILRDKCLHYTTIKTIKNLK